MTDRGVARRDFLKAAAAGSAAAATAGVTPQTALAQQPGSAAPAVPASLYGFLNLEEQAFVEALAATYEGTRDAWIDRTIRERGTFDAARADFYGYQGMEHLPEWWELAYTEDGRLAGLVMPARNPSVAVIAYVGVVPEQRGRGLATRLVRRGTEQLLAGGADEIRGDCDRDNIAMAKAFERAGYEQFARRRTYRHGLRAPGRSG